MKGSAILLGVCCFITLLVAGEGRRCGTRKQNRYWVNMRAEISCMKPKRQLVQLPVPDGYDYVVPSVAMLPQCTGHQCLATKDQCVPVKTRDSNLAVTAFKKNDYYGTCFDITVQNHLACGCDCAIGPADCSQTQMLDSDMCKCVCLPEPREQCIQRQEDGEKVMWDESICDCVCDVRMDCDSDEFWVREACVCVAMNQLEVSNENDQDAVL